MGEFSFFVFCPSTCIFSASFIDSAIKVFRFAILLLYFCLVIPWFHFGKNIYFKRGPSSRLRCGFSYVLSLAVFRAILELIIWWSLYRYLDTFATWNWHRSCAWTILRLYRLFSIKHIIRADSFYLSYVGPHLLQMWFLVDCYKTCCQIL